MWSYNSPYSHPMCEWSCSSETAQRHVPCAAQSARRLTPAPAPAPAAARVRPAPPPPHVIVCLILVPRGEQLQLKINCMGDI